MNLYSLLQASASDPVSPNILLNVTLADLHQLVVDTKTYKGSRRTYLA